MNFDDVSYVGVPEDNECIVNAVQIGKQLDLAPHIIRSWGDEFEEFLYIKKINGRMTYTQKSVAQFEWIKSMRDKGYGLQHIREQLRQKGFTHEDKALGLINPNDVNLMESIKTDLGIEMKNQLTNFLQEFVKAQEKSNIDLVADIKTEVEQTVQEQLEISVDSISKEINEFGNDNKNSTDELKSEIQNRFDDLDKKAEDRDIKLVEKLRDDTKDAKIKALELRIKELEEEQNQPKSLRERIFGKKK